MVVRRLAALRSVLCLALATCVEEPSGPPSPGPDAAGAAAASPAVLVGAGDIADCNKAWDSLTANLMDTIPGTVFALGDNAYPSGTSSDYANCYAPTWGRFKARTRPVPGNHDYSTAGAAGYFGYFGAAAGDPAKGYYSYDVGSWHIIALNSSVAHWVGSPQEQWLRADLAANPMACILAYWHYPLFSSSTVEVDPQTQNFWQDLYDAGAELVLNGHHHDYERFAPQTPAGAVDPVYGIREIIVGTGGGEGLFPFGATAANSEVRNNETMGVLKLTLSDGGYTWKFIPVQGKTFTDAGSGTCHGAPGAPGNHPPTAAPGGPYSGVEGTAVTFDGSASSDPDGDALTYAWDFGDGATGSGVKPTHSYADNGPYSVTLTVSDTHGATSAPGTTTAAIANTPPTVNAGGSQTAKAGSPFTLSATFSDPGVKDSPWSYAIDWGDGSPQTSGSTTSQSNPLAATHTYAAGGTDTVRVIVTDKDGGSGTGKAAVTVTANKPPTAGFTTTCSALSCAFTDGSTDADGQVTAWSWSFGDGGTATSQNPSHTYAAGGTYTVTLTVTDNQGATGSTSKSVAVAAPNKPPTAAFSASCSGLTCGFTSSSSDPDGSISTYSWTFGDGKTATSQNPSHTYAAGGTYTVTLTVTDNQGATASTSKSVTVTAPNQPPTAAFTASCSGLTCSFTSSSSDPDGSISAYSWTFGDGATSTAQNPAHTYAVGGTYTVTLKVTDNQGGTGTTSHGVTVTQPNQPPTAAFTSSCSGLTCSFTSTSSDPDGSISAYSWTFGDGATSTSQNPSHTYGAGGTYTVTLKVTDNQAATGSTSKSVTVTAPNKPPSAAFTASCSGLTCGFTSSSSDPDGSISAYSWTFGDGATSTSTSQNPSHTYATGGTYTVTLKVTDNQGATGSTSHSVTVSQPNLPPTVNAGSDATVLLGLLYTEQATFSDPDNDGPWSYTISWGDGSSTSGSTSSESSISATHTYLLPGSYTIRVTVVDSRGGSGSDQKVLAVVL